MSLIGQTSERMNDLAVIFLADGGLFPVFWKVQPKSLLILGWGWPQLWKQQRLPLFLRPDISC